MILFMHYNNLEGYIYHINIRGNQLQVIDSQQSTESAHYPSIISAHQEAGGWHCRSVAVWSNGSSTWTAVSWVEGAVAGQQW